VLQYAKKKKSGKNKNTPEKKVKQGDDVMVFNARKFTRKGSKMKKTWKGPYKVINISEKGVVTLKKEGVPLKVKYNIKLLKKYVKRSLPVKEDEGYAVKITRETRNMNWIQPIDVLWQQATLKRLKNNLILKYCHNGRNH